MESGNEQEAKNMAEPKIKLCMPELKLVSGELLDWTIPIINVGIKVPLVDMTLIPEGTYCLEFTGIVDLLISALDVMAHEWYKEKE